MNLVKDETSLIQVERNKNFNLIEINNSFNNYGNNNNFSSTQNYYCKEHADSTNVDEETQAEQAQ
ncbi:MAG: hypothetical protein NTX03_01305 [Bacteroidetes bacterium]|nr:hypothetical protein [Bacteroidota bacterium]